MQSDTSFLYDSGIAKIHAGDRATEFTLRLKAMLLNISGASHHDIENQQVDYQHCNTGGLILPSGGTVTIMPQNHALLAYMIQRKEILALKRGVEHLLETAHLASLLYATLEAPDAWAKFLCTTTEVFGVRGAQIIHQNVQDFRLAFTKVSGYNWSPKTYAAYAALIPEDPRLALFLERPGEVVHCRMGITDADYHQSRVYREVLQGAGVEYLCGVNFGDDRQHISGMFLLRDRSQLPFSQQECAALQKLVPDIRRVLDLHGFIGRLELGNQIAHDTLDALGAGVIVINENGKIDIANKAAQTLMMASDNIRNLAGHLHCKTRNGDTVKDMLRLVLSSQSMHPFEILRENGDPLLVFMTPHKASHGRYDPRPLQNDGAVIVIRATDARPDPAEQARVLELLWDLTPSQARLACLLSGGKTLQASAADMGITQASARQYLKVVFQKLEVHRQSDLVRKVLSVLVSTRPG